MEKIRTIADIPEQPLVRDLLMQGYSVRLKAFGASMSPVIRHGTRVTVAPVSQKELRRGMVLLFVREDSSLALHRAIKFGQSMVSLRGDACRCSLETVATSKILGKAILIENSQGRIKTDCWRFKCMSHLWLLLRPAALLIMKLTQKGP